MKMMRSLLVNRVNLRGFIVFDRLDLYARAIQQLGRWVSQGKIKYHETIASAWKMRPAHSSACSRAPTSASSWSKWHRFILARHRGYAAARLAMRPSNA